MPAQYKSSNKKRGDTGDKIDVKIFTIPYQTAKQFKAGSSGEFLTLWLLFGA